MPKERRHSKSRASPFPCSSSSNRRRCSSSSRNQPESSLAAKDTKEWEEVRCPVCMEHPHNAVLLLCTSHGKGCRPFMCDTSYRHSNCLDQYRKTFSGSPDEMHQKPSKILCPLCRGGVNGWTVVGPARNFMDAKARSCSLESCGYAGAYGELRKHARKDHPSVRPSEADPERQRDWRRMEQQRDLGDLFSTMQSAMDGGGEEGGEVGEFEEDDDDDLGGMLRIQPLMLFLVLRVSLPGGGTGTGRSFVRFSRGSSRGSLRSRRTRSAVLWGETTYSGDLESTGRAGGEEDNMDEDGESDEVPSPAATQQGLGGRPRRRLRMSDDDEDDDAEDDDGDGDGL